MLPWFQFPPSSPEGNPSEVVEKCCNPELQSMLITYHRGFKDIRFIPLSTIIQFLSKKHVSSSLLIGGAKKPHQRSVKKKKEEQDWILKHCDWITKLSVNTEKKQKHLTREHKNERISSFEAYMSNIEIETHFSPLWLCMVEYSRSSPGNHLRGKPPRLGTMPPSFPRPILGLFTPGVSWKAYNIGYGFSMGGYLFVPLFFFGGIYPPYSILARAIWVRLVNLSVFRSSGPMIAWILILWMPVSVRCTHIERPGYN